MYMYVDKICLIYIRIKSEMYTLSISLYYFTVDHVLSISPGVLDLECSRKF